MVILYNNESYKANLVFIRNDTINLIFDVYKWDFMTNDWVLWDITGMQVDVHFRRIDGLLVKELSSAGIAPEITISGTAFSIYDTGFIDANYLSYDVQITDSPDVLTVMEGNALIKKDITI